MRGGVGGRHHGEARVGGRGACKRGKAGAIEGQWREGGDGERIGWGFVLSGGELRGLWASGLRREAVRVRMPGEGGDVVGWEAEGVGSRSGEGEEGRWWSAGSGGEMAVRGECGCERDGGAG